MVDILYSIRPEIGRYCWDCTIYKGQNELEIPPEIIASHVEAQEEMMQKVTNGLDQMYIEEDAESNDEDDYVECRIEVPDLENALENVSENASENVSNDEENCRKKQKVQSKITSFFTNKK